VLNRQTLHFYPEKFVRKPPAASARKEIHVELPGNDNKAVEAHMRNWIEAIEGKTKVIAPTRVGQRARYPGTWRHSRCATARKFWDDKARKYYFV
jgi:hypothetical protein